jgi:hypothetical protein
MSTQIDARGPRFTAALNVAVLAAVLLLAPSPVAVILLAVQAGFFGVGAVRGIQHTPHAWLFRTLVRPRLAPPTHFEDAAPPRFAQAVGLAFAVVGLLGYLLDSEIAGAIAVGFALAAALLNTVFGFCLGCEMYLVLRRLTARTAVTN